MTLLSDPPETANPSAETDADAPTSPPVWFAAALGAGAALVSLLVLVVPVVTLWSQDPHQTGSWRGALGLASATWLATLGAHVTFDGVVISFVPLLLTALPVALLAWSWHWLLTRRGEDEDMVADLLPRNVAQALGQWWGGYAVIVAAAVGLSFWGPARPSWAWLPVVLLLPPVLAAAVATARVGRWEDDLLGSWLDGSRLPDALRRGFGPGLRGAALLLGLGALVVVAAVALSWEEVRAVQVAVGGGGGAAVAMGLVQVAALPNLAVWAVSFLAGPGFSVVQGASVTWSGSHSGLLPLVPVLAAHPQPTSFPWWVSLVALVPLLVGGLIGRWSLRTVARLSSVRTKVQVAGVAAVVAAVLVGLLDLWGGSSWGAYRLADIGAPAGSLVLALGAELVLGAVVYALWDAWRLRR